MSREKSGPAPTTEAGNHHRCTQYTAGLRRRRAATYRLPATHGWCRDPWTCRCDHRELTTDSAVAAAQHLAVHGLDPMFSIDVARTLWRAGHRDIATRCVQQVNV